MKHFVLAFAICALTAIALERSGIDVAKLVPPQGSITYTDRNGIALGTILGAGSARSDSVALDSVSPVFIDAILAAEDARFWHHGAVDVRALLRAARDYAMFGGARSGGSTIDMQLARLLFQNAGARSEIVASSSRSRSPSGLKSLRAKRPCSAHTSIAYRWAATSTGSKRRLAPTLANRRPIWIWRKHRC